MSYIALYRKYRPSTFETIVGQESVTKILKNQINSGKISHAYIFSGSRGTGKTSAAKVFARAINCLNPHDGEPCNECEVCKNILDGNTTDVIEMDAASNNSVENIRQIRQEVVYATIDVKYRVYIIDEAHMLTISAFNALLKTLEEPPENVVFILATTEQHKIPVTILSRCLRFEFNRISDNDIVDRLKFVLNEENIEYEEKAIDYIAKLAEGGMRDALSILERCICENSVKLEYKDIQRLVGAIDTDIIDEVFKSIISYDSVHAVENVEKVIKKGKDLRQFVYQLTETFLDKLISCNNDKKLVERYVRIIDRLSKLDNDLRLTTKAQIVLKSCLVELCNGYVENNDIFQNSNNSVDVESIMKKISLLEKQIIDIKDNKSSYSNIEEIKYDEQEVKKIKDEVKSKKSLEELNVKEFKEIEQIKKTIVESGKLKLYSAMAGISIYIATSTIVIITSNSFAYNILSIKENLETISSVFKEKYAISAKVIVELVEKNEDHLTKLEKLLNQINVEYTNLD